MNIIGIQSVSVYKQDAFRRNVKIWPITRYIYGIPLEWKFVRSFCVVDSRDGSSHATFVAIILDDYKIVDLVQYYISNK